MYEFKVNDTVKIVNTRKGYINVYLGLTGTITHISDDYILAIIGKETKWFFPDELEVKND